MLKIMKIKKINIMKYRIIEDVCNVEDNITGEVSKVTYFIVQVKFLFFWINVKKFIDEDTEYSKNCAEDLLDKLIEEI